MRPLKVPRQTLIDSLVNTIEQWKAQRVDLPAKSTELKALIRIADGLDKALKTANGKLDKLGVASTIERVRRSVKAEGVDLNLRDIAQMDRAVHLYYGVQQALNRVRAWNRMVRPGKGRPLSFSANLANQLEYRCRNSADLTENEFSDFLSRLSDRAGLPNFAAAQATLKKRRERSSSKPKTK
jgi:hypothetical protein